MQFSLLNGLNVEEEVLGPVSSEVLHQQVDECYHWQNMDNGEHSQ